MNPMETNSLMGIKAVNSVFPEMDFNRPLTAKLYKSAKKIDSIHARRFVMAVPGFFTALADAMLRIWKVPVAAGTAARLHIKNSEGRRGIKEFKKGHRISALALPIIYTLTLSAGLLVATCVTVGDVVSLPFHTAWRVSKM